jgi:phosphate starvation-inducible PhoH-like protein
MARKSSEKRTTRVKEDKNHYIPVHKEPIDLNQVINMGAGFKPKNKQQKTLASLMVSKEIVFAYGPAGVGKSYVIIAKALEFLRDPKSNFKKIILSKPAVEAEEKHGFLPGDVREKMDPFIASSLDIFDKIIGKPNRQKLEELELLQIEPLAYLRGKTIDNSILVMEEAQNMSPSQMKTLLTRIGENTKFIISGDLDQSDRYKNVEQSGLYDAITKHSNIPEIAFIEFGDADVVRNPIIKSILANYNKVDPHKPKEKSKQLLLETAPPEEKKGLLNKIFK